MEAGAHVWAIDENGDDAWILAEVLLKTEAELKLARVDDKGVVFTRNRVAKKAADGDDGPQEVKYEGIELSNAKLSDADRAEGMDNDLINLPHLHEPAILHAVGDRFDYGKIYTWTGPVLIAVNPFQRLPLYTNEILETYRQEGLLKSQGMGSVGKPLAPHIYAIADRSYRQMMAEGRKSQSILISGESGAGKTESTKIVMLYLTTLGSSHTMNQSTETSGSMTGGSSSKENLGIMERVLQSNPILEAFGNARTLRNDNSSRFGKFIELGFNRAGSLMGARVQTYLLEKVRLGYHGSGERNYHIFYQILRGMSEDQKKRYRFHDHETQGLELANHYHFTGQGGAPNLREFTDEDGLKYTLKAMEALGWDEAKIDTVLALTAGLLHLGQVNFEGKEGEGGVEVAVVREMKEVEAAAHLMGVDQEKLMVALTERILITRGEEIKTALTPAKAANVRDALAKTIYGSLFLWLVEEVNNCISWENDSDIRSSCGVLDIFGFECFATNSFEQLCINFTNEALQQQFNKFIFKMEQAEYEAENINWAFIEFPDNQDCLDTIQARPHGIMAMLDDECRLGVRGNDRNWSSRMYKHFLPAPKQITSDNTRFSATPVQKSRAIFCVRHFAGVVQYSADTGFLEKNRDEIPVTAKTLLETAPSQLVKDIFDVQKKAIEETQPAVKPGARGKPVKSKTVGQQFKEQLIDLIQSVEKTEPHYIRCLKPNDAAKPKLLTRRRLTEQLRYGGVLEAVRVARMGYPVRMDHSGFFQRYRMLLPSVPEEKLSWSVNFGGRPQDLCVKLTDLLLEDGKEQSMKENFDSNETGISRAEKIRRMQLRPPALKFPKTDVQLGASKVFMRKPPHDGLEAHRVFHQTSSAIMVQTWLRGLQRRMWYLVLHHAIETVQRFYRGCRGRERWWKLRKEVAAQLLSNHFHMEIYRRKYALARKGTVRLQGTYRGHATRRLLATVKIQNMSRMIKRCYMFRRLKSASIALQCAHRCRVARKVLADFKHELKDIGKLKQNNEKLKQEMASLKAMLAAQAQSDASKVLHQEELEIKQQEIAVLGKRIAELEKELKKEQAMVKKLEEDMEAQKVRAEQQVKEMQKLQKQATKATSVAVRSSQVRQSMNQVTAVLSPPGSPRTQQRSTQIDQSNVQAMPYLGDKPMVPGGVDPSRLAEQRALVAKMEEELKDERRLRRDADGEIIKLRAAMGGVKLSESDVGALLAPKLEELDRVEEDSELGVAEEDDEKQGAGQEQLSETNGAKTPAPQESAVQHIQEQERLEQQHAALAKAASVTLLEVQKQREAKEKALAEQAKARPSVIKSASEYFPMIRRGFSVLGDETGKAEEEEVALGWKVDITNRKEREESLRDEVHQFEVKMRKSYSVLEEGVEVSMWQLNRKMNLGPEESRDEFALKSSAVHVKLNRRGDLLVQSNLTFITKGGYLSKALGRRRSDKIALEPLPVSEILEVKAGCVGYDQTELPAAATAKPNRKLRNADNRHSSMFLTLKATQTPMASSRFYFLKFKSRSTRNDIMTAMRALLSDLQIHEGVSVSHMHTPQFEQPPSPSRVGLHRNKVHPQSVEMEMSTVENGDLMVPLPEVHTVVNREREMYDRLLLLLLQGNGDLKEKEDELLMLRGKLDAVTAESTEKDRVQANDSKLIMQLSKKLETLLMDNEDLRDQNDRLNTRLVAVECEKMNLMS